jgi:hypothetical protein
MDILIKRKKYNQAVEFLNENTEDAEWNVFFEGIKNDIEFLEFLKTYLSNQKDVLTLKLFLLKLLCFNSKEKIVQEIIYDIILTIKNSNSQFSSHILIINLLFVQTVKICVLDNSNKNKLHELINKIQFSESWFIELLEMFQFWTELGVVYELTEEYEKSLSCYQKSSSNEDKINELTEIINKKHEEEEQAAENNNNNNEIVEVEELEKIEENDENV